MAQSKPVCDWLIPTLTFVEMLKIQQDIDEQKINQILQYYAEGLTQEDISKKIHELIFDCHILHDFRLTTITVSAASTRLNRESALFLVTIKTHINNNIFKDRVSFLELRMNVFYLEFQHARNNKERKILIEKCTAILAEQIHISKDIDGRKFYLGKLEELVFDTENTFARVVCYVKTGVTKLIEGYENECNTYFDRAHELVNNSGDPSSVAAIYLFYGEIHRNLEQLERHPTNELRDCLINHAITAMSRLQCIDPEESNLWYRIFLIQILFSQVGIGNRLKIVPDMPDDFINFTEAHETLLKLERIPGVNDARFESFFNIGMARYFELKGDFEQALACAKRAQHFSEDGVFITEEHANIMEHKERILGKAARAGIHTQEVNEM